MSHPAIFVSYSHKDEHEKQALLSHLGVLKRGKKGFLYRAWTDDYIRGGEDWEQKIGDAIGRAKLAVLLISNNFLTSDFILEKEIPALLERREKEKLIVFPVIAKDCAWQVHDWLTKINVKPKNGRPVWGDNGSHVHEDLAAISREIAEILEITPQITVDTPEQRGRLLDLISKAELSNDDLQKAYRASLPSKFIPQSEATTEGILAHLWDIPLQQVDRTFPVFIFVARVARRIRDERMTEELRAWVDETYPHLKLGLQSEDIEAMFAGIETEVPSASTSASYLLVRVTPYTYNINRPKQKLYSIDIIFWEDDRKEKWHTDETPRPLKDIRRLLDETLAKHSNVPQIIEFFLPRELISHEVDQWHIERDMFIKTKLGTDYGVVVRSLDRITRLNKQRRKHWQTRWSLFEAKAEVADLNHVFWICDQNEHSPESLYLTLCNLPNETCLGLTFMPTQFSAEVDFFCAIIQAGIPIAFWSRLCNEECIAFDIRTKIETIISNDLLVNLPEIMRAVRFQAVKERSDATHLGHNLTLLWDDPNRLPPDNDPNINTRLQAP